MKNWMKCSIAAALAAAALISGGCGGQSGDASGKIKIGVVQIVQHGSLDEANRGFVDALKERGYGPDKVEIEQENAQGDQSNLKTIVSRFKAEKPKLICAIATPAAIPNSRFSIRTPSRRTVVFRNRTLAITFFRTAAR